MNSVFLLSGDKKHAKYHVIISGLEYVSPGKRSISGPLTMGLGNALAGMSEPWLLKYLVDWKIFHQILFSIPLIALVTPL